MPTSNLKQVDVQGYNRTVNGKLVSVHGYAHGVAAGNGNGGHIRRSARRGDPNQGPTFLAPTGIHPLRPNQGHFTNGRFAMAALPFGLRTGWKLLEPVLNARDAFKLPLSGELLLSASGDDWTSAVQLAVDHILLVVSNNPGRPLAEIVERPDVQEALAFAGSHGAAVVEQRLRQVWGENGGPVPSDYLEKVLSTIRANGTTFPHRMTAALIGGDRDQVRNILLKDRLRASAAESVLATRARAEHTLYVLRHAGVKHVRWQAHLDERTCSACRALHGMVIALDSNFPTTILTAHKLKPYGEFIAPPAHPNCRCYLVGVQA